MTPQALIANSHGSAKLPWLTAVLTVGLGLLYALFGPAPEALLLALGGDMLADPWRLVTGHLVHADPRHLAWNLGALLLLGAVGERWCGLTSWRFLGLLLFSALAIDLWLWAFDGGLARYCGLSGVLNGLFAALAIELWRSSRSPWALALLLGDLLKIAIEATMGGALLPTTSWQSVPGAHLAGLLAGLAWAFRPWRSEAAPQTWHRPLPSARSSLQWRATSGTATEPRP